MSDGRGSVLRAEDLVGGYVPEVDILNGCSVHVDEGELVVVIGPNGAGKSTLAKAVFGLVDVRSGRVLLHGEEITGDSPHQVTRKGMGYVPQRENVFPSLTVNENLEMGFLAGDSKHLDSQAEAMFALFPRLGERRRQRAGGLSGGERQMLAMARSLMSEPSVILLDEPSAGLAPQAVADVFRTVLDVNESGVTVLMIEQNAQRALTIADRGYVLEGGVNRFEGPGRALLDDPEVARLYLGG
ncbi:MAG: ABC transporter ATP-binding protein [Thermoleophilia bacterium]|nr:ABC transporter ATP-binding protein [Thermoleophilia bacterium]MDH3725577.1 ABC transporter ATP-binding protein [Thermoleophilia bacterium]